MTTTIIRAIKYRSLIGDDLCDFHCHLVPSVDDGSKDLITSEELMNNAKENGITKFICTPHYYENKTDNEIVAYNFKLINKNKNCYLGQELVLSGDTINLLNNRKVLTITSSHYILVEFNRYTNESEANIIEYLEELISYKYIPIIAHIEQYRNKYNKVNFITKLVEIGCLIQVSSPSFNKKKHLRKIKKLINKDLIHFVGSDAHNLEHRNYNYTQLAYRKVAIWAGIDVANNLFKNNQLAIINAPKKR